MTEPKHTLTPYMSDDVQTENGCYELLIGADGAEIGYIHKIDDAEFIVRACNAHDDLVAALEKAKSWMKCDSKWSQDHFESDIIEIETALAKSNAIE